MEDSRTYLMNPIRVVRVIRGTSLFGGRARLDRRSPRFVDSVVLR